MSLGETKLPRSQAEKLRKERDELLEWFEQVKVCCDKKKHLLDQELPAQELRLQPPPSSNAERSELNQLRVAVQVVQDLSPNDGEDLKIFEKLWKCVLPWFSRSNIGSDAELMLDTFMARLSSLLDHTKVADFVYEHLELLIDLPYPDALIELCRNPTFAKKAHCGIVQRFVEALVSFESKTCGGQVDSSEKWRCIQLGLRTVDILQASIVPHCTVDEDTRRRLAEANVNENEISITFFRRKVLSLLSAARPES